MTRQHPPREKAAAHSPGVLLTSKRALSTCPKKLVVFSISCALTDAGKNGIKNNDLLCAYGVHK